MLRDLYPSTPIPPDQRRAELVENPCFYFDNVAHTKKVS